MIFLQTVGWLILVLVMARNDRDASEFVVVAVGYLVWCGLSACHYQLEQINKRARRAQRIKDGD